ncbi:hypothetical protein BLNAU_22554 [Blattamonas nauphoetae]|uniref:Uncharacterized protein n=1 Tax=Blattamonas nauphoetae TaxID=2049346 RepID=A0ABQ9WSR4_9EUKA|nr:hypothetical protein BLNAU_22554 [Blattamonas nauphoetae]
MMSASPVQSWNSKNRCHRVRLNDPLFRPLSTRRNSKRQQPRIVQWTRKERRADLMRLILFSLPLSPTSRPISANSTHLLTSLTSKQLTHPPDLLFTLQNLHWLDNSFISLAIIVPSNSLLPSLIPVSLRFKRIEAVPSELFRLQTFFHLILSPTN